MNGESPWRYTTREKAGKEDKVVEGRHVIVLTQVMLCEDVTWMVTTCYPLVVGTLYCVSVQYC